MVTLRRGEGGDACAPSELLLFVHFWEDVIFLRLF